MHRVESTAAEAAALVDRLAGVEVLRSAPRAEREWLVAHGELRRYMRGEIMVRKSEEATELVVILSGRLAVFFDHGAGRRHLLESGAGSVTGVLPFSRLGRPPGDVVVEEPTELLAVHRDHLPVLTRQCPTITTALVHVMLNRARSAVATDWQDEKTVSLGRLAAGIAHELNNPASAAASMAKSLGEALGDVGDAARQFGSLNLTVEQRALVDITVRRSREHAKAMVLSPLERTDREEAVSDWLTSHDVTPRIAAALAGSGVAIGTLSELAAALPRTALETALGWIAAAATAQSLASEVELATARIYDLVSAVKRFTFMDRAGAPAPTDISQGLADTVAVLASKARQKAVTITLDVALGLPLVLAGVAELNQVWSNLLDNALDAVGPSGEVTLSATTEGDAIVVRMIDNGPGIPGDVLGRVFDPFFTTKPVGEGVGLGLEIARRIVRAHDGQIFVETAPGRTEFRVHLPRLST